MAEQKTKCGDRASRTTGSEALGRKRAATHTSGINVCPRGAQVACVRNNPQSCARESAARAERRKGAEKSGAKSSVEQRRLRGMKEGGPDTP
jgi:hypothetical protein